MKITRVGPIGAPERRRRIGAAAKPDAADFAVGGGDGAGGGAEIARTSPLGVLGAMLSVQEVSDATDERRRAVGRGHGLLDELDRLHLGLIDGRLSETTMRRLAQLLESGSIATEDRRLGAILEAIELRAAVELAKLDRAASPRRAGT